MKSILFLVAIFSNEILAASTFEKDQVNMNFDFSGQVSLGGCSGSIVKFSEMQSLTSKALLLTNGHCLGLLNNDNESIFINKPYKNKRIWEAYKNHNQKIQVTPTKIVYAIMQPHDLGLVELENTYQDLESEGIKARLISPSSGLKGDSIILAIGVFNVAKDCEIDDVIYRVKEDKWINQNSYKYLNCPTMPGSSGSALISAATGMVIGVHYTANESGEKCTSDNPCEVDIDGNVSAVKGAGYADPVYKITTCLNEIGEFDLTSKDCLLPK